MNALPGIVDLRKALYVGLFNNHDLIFTTSRVNTKGYSSQEQTRHWLEEKLGLHYPDVYVVPHQISKPDLLRTLGAHAHLDDFPPTVQVAKYHCQAYLLQQPWNEHDIAAYSIRSVSSVGRFLEALGLG